MFNLLKRAIFSCLKQILRHLPVSKKMQSAAPTFKTQTLTRTLYTAYLALQYQILYCIREMWYEALDPVLCHSIPE